MNRTLWPEENWERLQPWIELDDAELAAILCATLGRDDIKTHELLTGGKCNTNVGVEFADGLRVVVRVYERDVRACRRDELIGALVTPSVPAPVMLGAIYDPATMLSEPLATKLATNSIGIFEWMEGVKPFDAFEQDEAAGESIAYAIGAALAPIGAARRFESHGLLDEELEFRRRFASTRSSFVDFIDWSLTEGRAGQRLDADVVARLQTYAVNHAHILDQADDDHGLVHGDYKLSNLLVRSNGERWEVSAVLDWEFAFAGTPLFDAAILLRHADAWPFDFEGAFARGFTDHGGDLPEGWRDITRLLDLMNLCGFLNASEQRVCTFQAVRELIEKTIS